MRTEATDDTLDRYSRSEVGDGFGGHSLQSTACEAVANTTSRYLKKTHHLGRMTSQRDRCHIFYRPLRFMLAIKEFHLKETVIIIETCTSASLSQRKVAGAIIMIIIIIIIHWRWRDVARYVRWRAAAPNVV